MEMVKGGLAIRCRLDGDDIAVAPRIEHPGIGGPMIAVKIVVREMQPPPKLLPEDLDFQPYLRRIIEELPLTAATRAEIGAGRRDPIGRRFDHIHDDRACERLSQLDDAGRNQFAGRGPLNEDDERAMPPDRRAAVRHRIGP